jgi:hypothetical protein
MNPSDGPATSPARPPHAAPGAAERLTRIADLLGECQPPGMAGGYDQCAHGTWPCVITQAVWLAQGRDRDQEVHAACQATAREAVIEDAAQEAYEEWAAAEREGPPPLLSGRSRTRDR